jgi:signal transduction histidine kinase
VDPAESASRPALLAENIWKSYAEVNALSGVTLSLLPGEVHGLLGVDGSGKSTLIKILSGIEIPDSGSLTLYGQKVLPGASHSIEELGISAVHQYVRLVPNMSVTGNIMLSYAPKKRWLFLSMIDWKKVRQAAEEALELLEADIDPDAIASELTFAQQQVVKIAKALALKPRILLLDEPTYGLQEQQANALFRAIRMMVRKGASVLYVSQRLDEIPRISDRVSVLKEGQILGTMQAGEVNLRSVVELLVAETSQIMALREADRLRHEFVSLVSHELRTPLATIRGYAETVMSRPWNDEIRQECLENISAGCDRLTELVDNLLDMSSLDRGTLRVDKELFSVKDLVQQKVAPQWQRKAKEHLILLRFPVDFPLVYADSRRIEQVLSNLVDNAIKYSLGGSTVTISGIVDQENENVIITVEDQGPGIPAEHQDRVFERFYRVPHPSVAGVEGSGLGLAICKGILTRHAGRIWLKSVLGQGAAFSFSLPVANEIELPLDRSAYEAG